MAPGDTGEAGPALCLWMTWCTKLGLHQLAYSTYFIHSLLAMPCSPPLCCGPVLLCCAFLPWSCFSTCDVRVHWHWSYTAALKAFLRFAGALVQHDLGIAHRHVSAPSA